MLAILLFLGLIFWLIHFAFNHRPGLPFNRRDVKAFEKVKAVRDDLDVAKNLVAPAAPKPDYALTLGFTVPKPKIEGGDG